MLIGRADLDSIDRTLAESASHGASGLLLVHLRGMRQLVALLGIEAGAALADAAEARLRQLLRPQDQVWRLADDECLVVLPGLLSANHGMLAARKVQREFETPLDVLGRPMTPLLTLALATCTEADPDSDRLLRRALVALDRALERNNRLELAGDAADDLWLQDDLRDALVNNELSVLFQPVVALATRRIVAVEALARWNSRRHGIIPPSRFIALAEQAGLAPELTRWSVNAVLREYAPLRRQAPALRCAINLSPKVFSHYGFEDQIKSALAIWDVPPASLTLEVTETAVMEDPELSSAALRELRADGVRVAIDDFGQGYSSFSYLKHFPATELKIDQSFVTPMVRDARAAQLVRSIVDLAHHLDMEAVGEGVEDDQTAQALAALGCDLAQGYHLGRPMPARELLALM
ncbi:MAG: EAL domain-containing protein [Rhodanobacteraceae bacterium]|nr:EAL domain-containing protein [Rhodanobacteraceae bacterium]